MEEVPAHVHPSPIVPDVLTRQHEHQSGLIWSGGHETCFTDLQCRRFGRNIFQCEEGILGSMDLESFVWLPYHDRDLVPSDLWRAEVPLICYEVVEYHYPGSIQLKGNDHTCRGTQHASHVEAWHQWRLRVRVCPALAVEVLSYPNDEYIRWYRGITRTSMLQEVDDRASVTIIRKCMVTISGTLGCTPSHHDIQQTFPLQPSRHCPLEHIPDWGARGVKRGTRRQPGRGAGGGCPLVSPFPGRPGPSDPGQVEMERGEGSGQVERGEGSGGGYPSVDPFDSPNSDISSFSLGLTQPFQSLPGGSGTLRSPTGTFLGFSSFRAPPPPGTTGSSIPHQSISQAYSSDNKERTDDTNDVQHLGFGHRVGKKTTRFTPSDWP
ncbi:hypothetical protein M9H77_31586 [Catharanthus roseus]|uniref:Uncharacterized protein n=1 Tax=Catharanthus roseus TaxID=4058 RepID=A0ACC0A0V0_CATRO|nr:hypothetical protein M9H77_31586 [Catharanthus roseus]